MGYDIPYHTQPHYDDPEAPRPDCRLRADDRPRDGMELGIVLEAVHNRDGSVGRWTFLLELERVRAFSGVYCWTASTTSSPRRSISRLVMAVILKFWEAESFMQLAHRTAPELVDNMHEFVETGVWTEEMDQPMAGICMSGRFIDNRP